MIDIAIEYFEFQRANTTGEYFRKIAAFYWRTLTILGLNDYLLPRTKDLSITRQQHQNMAMHFVLQLRAFLAKFTFTADDHTHRNIFSKVVGNHVT